MKVNYDRFFKLLIDKKMKKGDLCKRAGISTNTMAIMAKGLNLNVDVLARICGVLNCTMDEILESRHHHFKWWLDIGPIRARVHARPKGRVANRFYGSL